MNNEIHWKILSNVTSETWGDVIHVRIILLRLLLSPFIQISYVNFKV